MFGWILFVNPVRGLFRLAGLCVLLALFLIMYRYEGSWPYALMGALLAVELAVIAWVLWTLFEVLVLIGALAILTARAVLGVLYAGRAVEYGRLDGDCRTLGKGSTEPSLRFSADIVGALIGA